MAGHAPGLVPELLLPDSPSTLVQPMHVGPLKMKKRDRLRQGLGRISSSPSLAKMGRTASSGYRTNKASVSCISLSTSTNPYGQPFESSISSELPTSYSTALTSAVSTPGIQIPIFDERARTKYLKTLEARSIAGLPSEIRPLSRLAATSETVQSKDYFSIGLEKPKPIPRRTNFNFWHDMPSEIRMEVLTYLQPKEIVRCSAVSKAFYKHCFDGQLWAVLDTSDFYQRIPAEALVKIITLAGPFVRDLNLRGCVQLREKWHSKGLSDACRHLENLSLEGCRIDRTSIHCFLLQNTNLVHLNLSGLAGVTNSALKILAQHCPRIEHLNVSWCNNVDTRGLRKVIQACPDLKDLRAGEIRGWDDLDIMQELFERNTLERLVLMNCDSLTDDALRVLVEGKDSEIDLLTGRRIVEPRRLKHLDLTRSRAITDQGLKSCVSNLVHLEGLQLSKCHALTDESLTELLPSLPNLTHLDLEELERLTNVTLQTLSNSPCAKTVRHLSISYCDLLGDTGMLPVLKNCTNLSSLDMDNTRVSDLVLAEAAAMVRRRSGRTTNAHNRPRVGLRVVAYDCQNVTWTGIREILNRNAEIHTQRRAITVQMPTTSDDGSQQAIENEPEKILITRSYPTEFIQLKCFYNYQPTVEEHTKRVQRGDFASANRLERKWADFMIANEEAGASGAGARRRRRRAREAQMMHADEADEASGAGGLGVGGGRRRRARSGGCVVM